MVRAGLAISRIVVKVCKQSTCESDGNLRPSNNLKSHNIVLGRYKSLSHDRERISPLVLDIFMYILFTELMMVVRRLRQTAFQQIGNVFDCAYLSVVGWVSIHLEGESSCPKLLYLKPTS
ncbi:hypothetical protein I7I50_07206 [Histoplasma capsulatum G186AR]|uniref:Uncharacterized protein n=1 Tax=Ajellomyces capsulatus TaxID=5037 RepID=A0A8H8D3E3_AJECA|nr:hypothetical protein I7I52_09722 [Histoplasma capsulatum]QSS67962.1 hypothetical protein I7I50_07206 [Histoplasma capsulatum G186AR]